MGRVGAEALQEGRLPSRTEPLGGHAQSQGSRGLTLSRPGPGQAADAGLRTDAAGRRDAQGRGRPQRQLGLWAGQGESVFKEFLFFFF